MFGALDVHRVNAVGILCEGLMTDSLPTSESGDDRIVLGLLTSLESDGSRSQRHLAAELGIALGLVNAYLKRAVKKGLVKVGQAPARRYAYYLTPHGFSEKSRLTVEYLSASFSFFRKAKEEYTDLYGIACARGIPRVVLAGRSDLCEIAILCAVDNPIKIVALVDSEAGVSRFHSVNVVRTYDDVSEPFDGVIITTLSRAEEVFEDAIAKFGAVNVLAPRLLGLHRPQESVGPL
jgi:DNA-binding MarR family transcriptional regulator